MPVTSPARLIYPDSSSFLQLSSPMNPVSSSEDIKPPLGLNGVLKVPAHPSGNMASFTKHICAICGDRSSGRTAWWAGARYLDKAHGASLAFSTGLGAGSREPRGASCAL